MRLVDLAVELRFKGNATLLKDDVRTTLIKEFDPDYLKNKKTQELNFVQIRPKDKRVAITAQENRYGVAIQDKNVKRAMQKINQYITTINKLINYTDLDIARLGVKTVWVHKCGKDISQLKNTFKEKFYKDNKIVSNSIDYAAVLTLHDKDFTVAYTAGPIEKNEPIPVSFSVSGLDEANVFVATDYFQVNSKAIKLAPLLELIDTAVLSGEQKAKDTVEILEVSL